MTRRRIINFVLVALLLFSFFGRAIPVQAASASLYLSPSTGTYVIGGTFRVSAFVNSDGADINAAEGSVTYDADLLDAVSVSKGNIFMFWTTEPVIGGGKVSFGGGNPSPYNGTSGHIVTITFRAKKAGNAQVRFNSGAVLANDGLGTNILASMGSASFTISPKGEAPSTNDNTNTNTNTSNNNQNTYEPAYNKPVIKSSTHPDPNTWYINNDVEFSWDLPSGVTGVSIAFDENPVVDPGPLSDGLLSEKKYEDVEGGIWYLHLKFKDSSRWGTASHQRIMIDLNPPSPFTIEVENIEAGEWPTLKFETSDEESGLAKYEVYVGSLEQQAHIVEADKKSIELTDLEAGHHTVLVKALDKAGNQRVETVEFTINPVPTPEILNYPREVNPDDNFYVSGTAQANNLITLVIEKNSAVVATSSTRSDSNGNWFYIHEDKLDNGRYTLQARAENNKGINSELSSRISFLVSPPVFAVVGAFIIDYFTVFVSLLFMVVLIIVLIIMIVMFVRKKLRKETIEVEEVLKRNLDAFRKDIDSEYDEISTGDTKPKKKVKDDSKERLKAKLNEAEKRIMKEVKDVEDILK
ncbi:hypothetical protein C0583_04820 [Candidatus Parcubacteria bacterium]|nr:MAG: hypothetical protein C0583_04820 [Candidatus Parcubacteria bacterium]